MLTEEEEERLKRDRLTYENAPPNAHRIPPIVPAKLIDMIIELNEECSKYAEELYKANAELARRAEVD